MWIIAMMEVPFGKRLLGSFVLPVVFFAEDEARLLMSSSRNSTELAKLVDRRIAGFPLEHIIGWAEFCGLQIQLDPGVFVPRPRTEFLVRQAVPSLNQET